MPNLRGASPLGRGEGGGLDAATAVDGGASQRGWSGRADGHDQGAGVAASRASRGVGWVDGHRPWADGGRMMTRGCSSLGGSVERRIRGGVERRCRQSRAKGDLSRSRSRGD